jgi:hypothetical protein
LEEEIFENFGVHLTIGKEQVVFKQEWNFDTLPGDFDEFKGLVEKVKTYLANRAGKKQ